MWHEEAALWLDVAIGVIVEHYDAVVQVVVDGVDLPVRGVESDTGNVADLRSRADDLPKGRGGDRRFISARALVNQNAFPVFVAHCHAVIFDIEGDAVEGR